jgi:hypothetical protein
VTSDHRVAGSSPAGCKPFLFRHLRRKGSVGDISEKRVLTTFATLFATLRDLLSSAELDPGRRVDNAKSTSFLQFS